MTPAQFWTAIIVVIIGYALGFYFQHRDVDQLGKRVDARIDDLRAEMNHRIDDLRAEMNHRIDGLRAEMNHRFDDMRTLIEVQVRRLDDRIDHVERGV